MAPGVSGEVPEGDDPHISHIGPIGLIQRFTSYFCTMQRKIRVLIAKAGLDGHDRGAKVIAAALRDAGMEVIYTGLRQTPEMIAEAALQEDVDVVGISMLSGAHMTIFPRVLNLLRERGLDDVLLTGGGIMSDEDIEALMQQGTGKLFTPGAPMSAIVAYINDWYEKTRAPKLAA
jgi:methylmalonyl-CoA mutase, C-terminal domain